MPVYIYQTTDEGPDKTFEIHQRMTDAALTCDPESGRPVKRVITGGIEMPRAKSGPVMKAPVQHSNSCACCNPRPIR